MYNTLIYNLDSFPQRENSKFCHFLKKKTEEHFCWLQYSEYKACKIALYSISKATRRKQKSRRNTQDHNLHILNNFNIEQF